VNKPDTVAARELTLYITNTGEIYQKYTVPTVARLAHRVVNGTYDPTKAVKAWLYIADIGAQQYTVEYSAKGDSSYGIFSKPTRLLCSAELMTYYQEHIDNTAESLRIDKKNKEVWTLSAIRQRHEQAGLYFFTRDTMRHFGDTMKSFSVHCAEGKIYIVRVKAMRDSDGRNMGGIGDKRLFNPETGRISPTIREESDK
jgi:hypothetical protein